MTSSKKKFSLEQVVDILIEKNNTVVPPPAKIKITGTDRKRGSSESTASKSPVRRFYGTSKCLTLADACDEVESTDKEVRNVTILPPDKGDENLTDEEDDIGDLDGLPRDVAGTLEVNFESDENNYDQNEGEPSTVSQRPKRARKQIFEDYQSDEEDVPMPKRETTKKQKIAKTSKEPVKKKKKKSGKKTVKGKDAEELKKPGYKWTKSEKKFRPLKRNGTVDGFSQVSHLEGETPLDIWSLLFTTEMVEDITAQTLLYASRDKGDHNFLLTSDEIYQFLGIILFSGYHHVPSEKHYWSTEPDLHVSFIANEISRNRYQKIKHYFHLADNDNLEKGNKVAKVQPIYDSFNRNIKQFGLLHSTLSIDESMVPYKGLHPIRQYMKSKPIKFGYKLWALCGVDGYPYHLDIYCGKTEEAHGEYGLGGNVVLSMVNIVDEFEEKNVEFFFDNYFSSNQLLVNLSERKILATGTVRSNRTQGADLILLEKKLMEKTIRGTYDFACTNDIFITNWNDNSIVQMISNCHQIDPINNVKRRVKGQGEQFVSQPKCIQEYNEGMGGVDQMDRLLQSYRPTIHMRKWWFALFVNLLNASVTTSWRLYLMANPKSKMTHLDFRRYIVRVLVCSGATMKIKERRSAQIPAEVRLDGINHIIGTMSQGRCRICNKNTTKCCVKCQIRLHTDRGKQCFYQYHNNDEL